MKWQCQECLKIQTTVKKTTRKYCVECQSIVHRRQMREWHKRTNSYEQYRSTR